MMNQDIEKVLISEEQIQEKVLELGAIIAEDYKKPQYLLRLVY